jgi:hypothetical protein
MVKSLQTVRVPLLKMSGKDIKKRYDNASNIDTFISLLSNTYLELIESVTFTLP